MFPTFKQIPLDPIFQLLAEYKADTNPNKVNLGIGLYFNENGDPVVLETIKKAFQQVDINNFDYQPIGGNREYLELTAKLILNNPDLSQLAMQATCGGTQAVSMMAGVSELEAKEQDYTPTLLIGIPTWSNHLSIFQNFNIIKFNHLNSEGYADLNSYKQALESAPNKATLLIHGGKTHNPSGQNLSLEEFLDLTEIINKKEIKVLIDSAYFGFGDTFDNDANFLTQLLSTYDNVAIAQSYSKNASLYEHRTGALFVKTNNKAAVESQLQNLARISISMAPGLGQEIMINILANHFAEWEQEVNSIRVTLTTRREMLITKLPQKYQFLLDSKGMFGLLPLSPDEINKLKLEHSIYIPGNGRINFAGVNQQNVDKLINAISAL